MLRKGLINIWYGEKSEEYIQTKESSYEGNKWAQEEDLSYNYIFDLAYGHYDPAEGT